MRVTCQHCAKALTIADDKAPAHPFQLTCPACKKSFVVNPVAPQEDQPNDVPQGEKRNVDTPAPAAVGKLPRLRPAERDLLASIVPVAYIVDLAQSPPQNLAADLERLGMEEVRRFESLDDALETLSDTGAGILVICMDKASAPPCAPLRPLERLTYTERRQVFVVLVANNVKSLDGQVAFYLQVNCLINAQDADRFGALVRRALLYHLRLYRDWVIETAS